MTHYNAFLAGIATGAMSELRWTGPGGFAEDGVVIDPPNPAPGRKYPVVLLIHGGPGLSSQRDFVWEQWPLAQTIAARGYVVFEPNYRGSDNLGNAYMTAIVHDTVVGPSSDILAGLTALGTRPEVDSARVAVSGWSYGGELTSWLIGHYHFWRAAISGAAVNNEFDEYNLSTSNVQDRYPLGASPWTADGRTHLPRELADHVLRADYDADADLGHDARSGRSDHAVVRALSRADGEPRPGSFCRLPGRHARTRQSRARRWS